MSNRNILYIALVIAFAVTACLMFRQRYGGDSFYIEVAKNIAAFIMILTLSFIVAYTCVFTLNEIFRKNK